MVLLNPLIVTSRPRQVKEITSQTGAGTSLAIRPLCPAEFLRHLRPDRLMFGDCEGLFPMGKVERFGQPDRPSFEERRC